MTSTKMAAIFAYILYFSENTAKYPNDWSMLIVKNCLDLMPLSSRQIWFSEQSPVTTEGKRF